MVVLLKINITKGASMLRRNFIKKTSLISLATTAGLIGSFNWAIGKSRKTITTACFMYNTDVLLYPQINLMKQYVKTASENDIEFEFINAGTEKLSDLLKKPEIDMVYSPLYNIKYTSILNLLYSVPFGMNPVEASGWLQYENAQHLFKKLMLNKYNVDFLLGHSVGQQMGGWFNKKINTAKDFKDLRIRCGAPLAAEIYKKMGAINVNISGPDEILGAFSKKILDAVEFINPYYDLVSRLPLYSKYYYWPGLLEANGQWIAIFKPKLIDKIGKNNFTIIQQSIGRLSADMRSLINYKALKTFDKLVNDKNVRMMEFPENIINLYYSCTKDTLLELESSLQSDLEKEIFNSYFTYLKKVNAYAEVSMSGYLSKRLMAMK